MRWRSLLTEKASYRDAIDELKQSLSNEVPPDLAFCFFSEAYTSYYDEFHRELSDLLNGAVLVGCSASGLSGQGKESEHKPGVSLLCGWTPGVTATPFCLEKLPDLDAPPEAWRTAIAPEIEQIKGVLILGDPFSLEAEALLAGLDFAYPEAPKVGGLASGCARPGDAALFCGDKIHRRGCVGVALSGDITVSAAVAQGCEPVGEQMVITDCRANVILELDNKPASLALTQTVQALKKEPGRATQRTVFVGLGGGRPTLKYEPGDFLVRQMLGIDPRTGCIAVAARIRKGQTVQFHLRDAQTSTTDLKAVLRKAGNQGQPAGALMFSCLGRGQTLYGEIGHDSRVFHQSFPDVPLGGFFCNGEFGPVGPESALHGFTSSFALFRPTGLSS